MAPPLRAMFRLVLLYLCVQELAVKTSGHGMPPLFRLGGGAVASQSTASVQPADASSKYQGKPAYPRVPLRHVLLIGLPLFFSIALLIMMMPVGGPSYTGNSRDFNYRIPPSWSPENENNYSFRAYMTDISIWIMLTDLHHLINNVQLS